MTNDKMLARIAALLRQAEGTDNPHEADAFMSTAQRLATAASIDLAVARSHAGNRSPAQAPTQRTITIGAAGTRGLRTYVQLFVLIAAANDVRCDVASNSTFVYAYGFAEDIDTSHALYASLVVQMVRASDAYLASGAHRPTPTITARLNFQLAFGARVGQRLADAREQTRQEATKDRDRPPGTAIACGTRTSSCMSTTVVPLRRAAPGEPAGPPRDTRRRHGAPVIERDGKHDSGTTPSCPGHGPRWAGDRRGRSAGFPACQGVRGRGVRPDLVRPRHRTRLTDGGVLRYPVDAAPRRSVRFGGIGAALCGRRACATGGRAELADGVAGARAGAPGGHRGAL